MNSAKVIVLILSYNGKSLLVDSVSSYLNSDYPNFKVVVIDNGSTDGTQDWVEQHYPDVFVLRLEKNLGYSGGFNVGLDYAFNQQSADYVLITNNDVKVDQKVVSALVKVAQTDSKIGFVTGKVYYYDNPDMFQTVGKHECPIRWNGEHIGQGEKDMGQYDEVKERIFIDDIFTLASKKLYETIGGYDTTFQFQAEEYDWQARAKNEGFKIFYTPHAKIWHKESMTIGKWSPFKAYYDARNPAIVLLLHKSPTFFKKYFWPYFLKFIFLGSIRSVKKGQFSIAIAIWRGFFSMLKWGLNNNKFSFSHFI